MLPCVEIYSELELVLEDFIVMALCTTEFHSELLSLLDAQQQRDK